MFRAGGEHPQVASVTCMQLLLTNLVERVHDAVWVVPRNASERHQSQASEDAAPAQPLNLDEYALDIAYSIRKMRKESSNLPRRHPNMYEETRMKLKALVDEEAALDQEIRDKLETAKAIKLNLDRSISQS